MISVVCSVGGESLHAEAPEDTAEEAVPDCEGEDSPARGSQQGHFGSQQVRESVSWTAETQQNPEGLL